MGPLQRDLFFEMGPLKRDHSGFGFPFWWPFRVSSVQKRAVSLGVSRLGNTQSTERFRVQFFLGIFFQKNFPPWNNFLFWKKLLSKYYALFQRNNLSRESCVRLKSPKDLYSGCYGVLQCVAMFCRVLQCVTVCCSVFVWNRPRICIQDVPSLTKHRL